MSEPITLKDALTPSFLKTVLSEALLAEIMTSAMVYRGQAKCVEDCVTPGYYNVNANSYSEYPPNINSWNFGILEVLKRDSDLVHRLTHIDGEFVMTRVRRNNKWYPWNLLTMEQVSD